MRKASIGYILLFITVFDQKYFIANLVKDNVQTGILLMRSNKNNNL
jgi:hypothetical protein